MRTLLTVILLLVLLVPVEGQQMEISGFGRQKRGLLDYKQIVTDKKFAVLELKTGEKGFTFKANGTTDVEAEEGDGGLTLKLPHKTAFLVVKHPDYGQLTWKVPDGPLRKKKRYTANLLTFSPDKEYKLQKQWAVFKTEPRNAILTVDSVQKTTRDGEVQYYLPLGKHGYKVESPFFESVEDTLELTDTARLVIPVTLQAKYAYMTVRTSLPGCYILLDGEMIGQTAATSGHLNEGLHRVMVYRDGVCYYDKDIQVGKAEKKVVELTAAALRPIEKRRTSMAALDRQEKALDKQDSLHGEVAAVTAAQPVKVFRAPVKIQADNDSTMILVNLEPVGLGSWEGVLEEGFYSICTRKDGIMSRMQYLWISDEEPKELRLLPPLADYGVLNIHSNVIGAAIYINNVMSGYTPCTLTNLPGGKTCRIRLSKDGYRDVERKVEIIGNDMVDVRLDMVKIVMKD